MDTKSSQSKTSSGLITSHYKPSASTKPSGCGLNLDAINGRIFSQTEQDRRRSSGNNVEAHEKDQKPPCIEVHTQEIKPFDIDSVKGRVYAQRTADKQGWRKL
jgi:hypothetical protein